MIAQPSFHNSFPAQDGLLTQGVISRRIAGWLIDAAFILVICAALWTCFAVLGVLTFGLGFGLFAALPAVPVLYHWWFVASAASATPGQAFMGLVVRREEDLGPVSSLQALVASGGFYLTIALGAIWLAVALITPRKRALHDILAGTVVVRAGALTGPARGWNMAV